jgi:hypothetical protein
MNSFVYSALHRGVSVKSFRSVSVSYSQCSITQLGDIYQQKSERNHYHQYFAFTQFSLSFQSFEYSSSFISNSGGISLFTPQERSFSFSFSFKLTLSFSIESYAFFGSHGNNYQTTKQHNNVNSVSDVAGKELGTPKLIGEEKNAATLSPASHPPYTRYYNVPVPVQANQPTTPTPKPMATVTPLQDGGRENGLPKGGKPSREQKVESANSTKIQQDNTESSLMTTVTNVRKEIAAPNSKLGGLTFPPNLKLKPVSAAEGRPKDLPDHKNLGGKFTKADEHKFVDPSSFQSQSEKNLGTHTRALHEARVRGSSNTPGKQ